MGRQDQGATATIIISSLSYLVYWILFAFITLAQGERQGVRSSGDLTILDKKGQNTTKNGTDVGLTQWTKPITTVNN